MKRLGILIATAVVVLFVGCREEPKMIYQQPPVYCCPQTCAPACTPAPVCTPAYSNPTTVQPRR